MAPFVNERYSPPALLPDLPVPRTQLRFVRHPFGAAESPTLQSVRRRALLEIRRYRHLVNWIWREMDAFFRQVPRHPVYHRSRLYNPDLNIALPAYLCGRWSVMTRTNCTALSSNIARFWVWGIMYAITAAGDDWMWGSSRAQVVIAQRVTYGEDFTSGVIYADMINWGEVTTLVISAVVR